MQNQFSNKCHIFQLAIGLTALLSIVSCKKEAEEEILFKQLEENVVLESQEDVNDFAAQKITHLRGNLTLQSRNGDPDPIIDISGLSRLTTIEGTLSITGTSLADVDAFSSLTQLDGELVISSNEELKNLDGFIALGGSNRVFETIRIRDNSKLTTINQFDAVVEMANGLFIWNNESLTEVDFSGLIQANIFGFSGNSQMRDLRGLSNLKKVAHLYITNTSLTSLNGLESLEEVESIELRDNHLLTAIDQFSQLTVVSQAVDLNNNRALASVDFNSLTSTGSIRIHNSRLEDLSGFPSLEFVQSIQLSDNPVLLDLDELLDTTIKDWLWLTGTQITSLELLEGLDLSGGLAIQESGLTDLKGLEHIETVKDFWILDNHQLTSLDGLQNLSRIEDEISISRNPLLESLEGLNALERVENRVRIYNNTNLMDYCALDLLVADGVAVFAEIDENAYNPTLQDIRRGDCKL